MDSIDLMQALSARMPVSQGGGAPTQEGLEGGTAFVTLMEGFMNGAPLSAETLTGAPEATTAQDAEAGEGLMALIAPSLLAGLMMPAPSASAPAQAVAADPEALDEIAPAPTSMVPGFVPETAPADDQPEGMAAPLNPSQPSAGTKADGGIPIPDMLASAAQASDSMEPMSRTEQQAAASPALPGTAAPPAQTGASQTTAPQNASSTTIAAERPPQAPQIATPARKAEGKSAQARTAAAIDEAGWSRRPSDVSVIPATDAVAAAPALDQTVDSAVAQGVPAERPADTSESAKLDAFPDAARQKAEIQAGDTAMVDDTTQARAAQAGQGSISHAKANEAADEALVMVGAVGEAEAASQTEVAANRVEHEEDRGWGAPSRSESAHTQDGGSQSGHGQSGHENRKDTPVALAEGGARSPVVSGAGDAEQSQTFSEMAGIDGGTAEADAGSLMGPHGASHTDTSQQTDTTRAAASSRPLAPPHPASETVSVQLSRMAGGKAEQMTIHLRPVELGQVEVRLDFSNEGRVQAMIVAERPETLELLQRDARTLEKALQEAGLQTDAGSLNFSLRDGGSGDRSNFAAMREALGKMRGMRGEADPVEEIRQFTMTTGPRGNAAQGRVDIRI